MKEKKVEVARAEKVKEEARKEAEEKKVKKASATETDKNASTKAPESAEGTGKVAGKDVEKKLAKSVKEKSKKVTKKKLPEEIHTINLRGAYDKPRSRRTAAAVDVIRNYVRKHKRKDVKISPELNSIIWERSIEKPPRKIRVKLVIGPEEVTVYPAK